MIAFFLALPLHGIINVIFTLYIFSRIFEKCEFRGSMYSPKNLYLHSNPDTFSTRRLYKETFSFKKVMSGEIGPPIELTFCFKSHSLEHSANVIGFVYHTLENIIKPHIH